MTQPGKDNFVCRAPPAALWSRLPQQRVCDLPTPRSLSPGPRAPGTRPFPAAEEPPLAPGSPRRREPTWPPPPRHMRRAGRAAAGAAGGAPHNERRRTAGPHSRRALRSHGRHAQAAVPAQPQRPPPPPPPGPLRACAPRRPPRQPPPACLPTRPGARCALAHRGRRSGASTRRKRIRMRWEESKGKAGG